jgi:iron complex transport system substrate-binding protein
MLRGPQRIVCLTEEPTETLYLLGEQDRIVGISGFTVRPPQARKEKPKVSAFTSAKIDKIVELKPDLVIGFSNLQADIAADLIRHGIAVHIFNHRTVAGIFDMIAMVGAMVGAQTKAEKLISELQEGVARITQSAAQLPRRPRVYFEEWDDPLISGIGWVSELVEIAGGQDCFPELAREQSAKQRIVADPAEVIRRSPDIIIGSWCGKKFQPQQVCARPGWDGIPAVRHRHVVEIKSPNILQPGPAALTDGVQQLHAIVRQWAQAQT